MTQSITLYIYSSTLKTICTKKFLSLHSIVSCPLYCLSLNRIGLYSSYRAKCYCCFLTRLFFTSMKYLTRFFGVIGLSPCHSSLYPLQTSRCSCVSSCPSSPVAGSGVQALQARSLLYIQGIFALQLNIFVWSL